MKLNITALAGILILSLSACNLPGLSVQPTAAGTLPQVATSTEKPATPAPPPTVETPVGVPSGLPMPMLMPASFSRILPPPIVPQTKAAIHIGADPFDVYQQPGDRFRVVCKQPCPLDGRMVDALYSAYKVSAALDVRAIGMDIVDSYRSVDIHLTRDSQCQRNEGELGLTGSYQDEPDRLFICLYLSDSDLQDDPTTPFTPEAAIRAGGLGVFAHEYFHAVLLGRLPSSHDFIYPLEYSTVHPELASTYQDLCDPMYQGLSPLSYALCLDEGFTYEQMLQSLLDANRLFEDGLGNYMGEVGFTQYLVVLDHLLGKDVRYVFDEIGYSKIFYEETGGAYDLPYKNEPCTYQAAFVSDVTIPVGAMLDSGVPFSKTWSLRNTGTCVWNGLSLAFVRGDRMSAPESVAVPSVASGESVQLTVPMTAPAASGVHTGQWRLQKSDGKPFGPIINLVVYTRPGCSVPPVFSFFKADPPVIGAGALVRLSWGQVTNVDSLEIEGIGPVDLNGGAVLVNPSGTTTYTARALCGSSMAEYQAQVTLDSSLPPFEISNIEASVTPAEYSGSCSSGIPLTFIGQFETNGPGAVLVRWVWEDGSLGNPELLLAENAGRWQSAMLWQRGGSGQGFLQFDLLAPAPQASRQARYSITCTP